MSVRVEVNPQIITWACQRSGIADADLVAQGHANNHIVVTHEVPSQSTKKIKVADACIGVGVKYMNPFQMLRREHARLVLGTIA